MMKSLVTTWMFLLTSLSYAQAIVPCVTKNGTIDLSCRCQAKKTCMRAMDKKEKANLRKLSKRVGKKDYILKSKKISMPGLKAMGQAFSGHIDLSKIPNPKLEKVSAKLSKINKKLIKKAERQLKKKGVKTYRIADRVKKYNQRIEKVLGLKAVKAIKDGKIKLSPEAMFEGKSGKGFGLVLADSKKSNGKTKGKNKSKNGKDPSEEEEKLASSSEIAANQKEQLANVRRKKYKFNDINNDPNKDLFSIISARYHKSINKIAVTGLTPVKQDFKDQFILESNKKQVLFELMGK